MIEPGIELAVYKNCTYSRTLRCEETIQSKLIEISSILGGESLFRLHQEEPFVHITPGTLVHYNFVHALDYCEVQCRNFTGVSLYVNFETIRETNHFKCNELFSQEWAGFVQQWFQHDAVLRLFRSSRRLMDIFEQLLNIGTGHLANFMYLKSKVFELLALVMKENDPYPLHANRENNDDLINLIKNQIKQRLAEKNHGQAAGRRLSNPDP